MLSRAQSVLWLALGASDGREMGSELMSFGEDCLDHVFEHV